MPPRGRSRSRGPTEKATPSKASASSAASSSSASSSDNDGDRSYLVLPPNDVTVFSTPPYPFQKLNNLLHYSETVNIVVYSLFWTAVLAVGSPLAAVVLVSLVLPLKLLNRWYKELSLWRWDTRNSLSAASSATGIHASLAVVITGCDTGFGNEMVWELLNSPPPPPSSHFLGYPECQYDSAKYVVFATCFSSQGAASIQSKYKSLLQGAPTDSWLRRNELQVVQLDVTSDASVSAMAAAVSSWSTAAVHHAGTNNDGEEVRFLHGLINNAGIGTAGYVDWLPIERPAGVGFVPALKNDMEVNFYGAVRCVKALLPIIKRQATTTAGKEKRYRGAVIVNVTSMAGLISMPGMSAYCSSKFACEAFSTALRSEVWDVFGCSVVTCNPSFHKTPLVDGIGDAFGRLWNSMSEQNKAEYGPAFFHESRSKGVRSSKLAEWESYNVSRAIGRAIRERSRGQLMVGADARYGIALARHLPVWLQDFGIGGAARVFANSRMVQLMVDSDKKNRKKKN